MAVLYVLLGLPSVVSALAFIFGALNGRHEHGGAFLFVLFTWGPLIALILLNKNREKKNAAIFSEFILSNEGSDYSIFKNSTGIAVSKGNKKLFLNSKKNSKVYAFDQVRGWEKKVTKGGKVLGGGLNATAANLKTAQRNAMSTGIFVQVKDIEYPEWHIRLENKHDIDKWYEILQQFLNEN